MGRLDNKVAVITGAASRTAGRATRCALRGEGAAVVAADLNSQGGELVVSEIAAAGGRAVFQRTDVTAEGDIAAMIDRAMREYGRLDITYNNAGVLGALGPIEEIKAEYWDRTLAVLARSVFFGIKLIPEVKPIAAPAALRRVDRLDCHRWQVCAAFRGWRRIARPSSRSSA